MEIGTALQCLKSLLQDGLVKIGMFGATSGTMRDIDVAPKHLKAVTIRSIDTIDRLTFHFDDEKGNQIMGGEWGGNLGNDHTFYLDRDEYLKQVSGTFGPFELQKLPCTVNSLTFISNKGKRYGPFGTRGAKDTSFDIPVEKGSIVGFYARADGFVSAIGFYIRP
ncbi:protein GOS9-like [Oryza brachyantha]|uniref:Jacalin-type lectin domain-containing protein n=1 Tax=Oryza brachyantha TaxID=4533 RepID=J3KZR1_ORYBR|nr:protein GOS9-like [Oryza brachyantha]